MKTLIIFFCILSCAGRPAVQTPQAPGERDSGLRNGTGAGVGSGARTMDYASPGGFSTLGGGDEIEEEIYEADTPLQQGAEHLEADETSGSGAAGTIESGNL